MNIGIIGAGWIAGKMAVTLSGLPAEKGLVKYAIASRDIAKAREFAAKWGFAKAYGSYQELVDDPDVDLVYIATPHSHHYPHSKLALEAGKAVLCEKAFMANAREAEEILNLAHKKGIFITEAIWTRYMPLSLKVKELLDAGEIGKPSLLNASLCYQMDGKERILRPDLCGGALLDLGVYSINFARMYYGSGRIDALAAVQKVLDLAAVAETVENHAQVYPNPSTGSFTVVCESMKEASVFSLDGRLVRQIPTDGSRCSIEGLNDGVYLLKIRTKDGNFVRKLVKM